MKMSSENSAERYCGSDILRRSQLANRSTQIVGGQLPTAAKYIPQTIKPVPDSKLSFHCPAVNPRSGNAASSSTHVAMSRSQKRKPFNGDASIEPSSRNNHITGEPQTKVHLTDDYVAQTMSELFISNPKPKVARRNCNRDVAEAINLDCLDELEQRFSNQAINDDLYSIPPMRSRKLPRRTKSPQLRLTLHQDLRSIKSSSIIPESLISRYKPTTRQDSRALVLWKPPGGIIPDVITSTLKPTRGRTRCFSEVTNTPYSSKENLIEFEPCETVMKSNTESMSNQSPISAEAPELHSPSQLEDGMTVNVHLQRRNSAPEISEPLPFLDDGSMEL